VKRGGLPQESKSSLQKGKHKNKNGVLDESLAAINSQQGGDWGKRKCLIPKDGKSKDLLRLTSCVTLLFYLKQFLHGRPPLRGALRPT